MSTEFEESPELLEVAGKLIDKYHEHLEDAMELIGFYMRTGSADWAGKAKKCTAFESHVTGRILFVFINAQAWRKLNDAQKLALMDHELCHFVRASHREYDDLEQKWKEIWSNAADPDNWTIRDHDVEEFSDVIQRHGLWEQGIEQFAVAVRNAPYQASLFEGDDDMPENVHRFGRAAGR